jgi:hypothetical protein
MRLSSLAYGVGLCAAFATAAAQAPEPPKPGPEHKAMNYFVGKWSTEGEMKPGPFGPGGKMSSQDSCEWFSGGFHVVCRGEGKTPSGPMKVLGVLAYNPAEKAYTYYGIDNMGMAELSTGAKDGKNWTFTSKSQMEGGAFHSRYTMTETSPTSYTFKWDTSLDGSQWTTVMEGKSTKTGA